MTPQPAPTNHHPASVRAEDLVEGMELTVEQFLDLPDTDDRHELVNGRLTIMPPPEFPHAQVQFNIGGALHYWIRTIGRGRGLGEVACHLAEGLVRAPDLCWVEHLPEGGSPRKLEGAPDLVIEIRSPRDSWKAMTDKAAEYLTHGGRLVWLIDPERRLVEVHRNDASPLTLTESDALQGGDVLPGFSIGVAEIFI
ncbi:MAG: Uma2 family endonuclease [Planctomycetota bacterium]